MTGDTGPQGPPGPRSGGVTYVRWGRTTCPDTEGTELVYIGRAAGGYHHGGGGNYECATETPENFDFGPGTCDDALYIRSRIPNKRECTIIQSSIT